MHKAHAQKYGGPTTVGRKLRMREINTITYQRTSPQTNHDKLCDVSVTYVSVADYLRTAEEHWLTVMRLWEELSLHS